MIDQILSVANGSERRNRGMVAAARRRPAILEAAMAVIARHGLSGTTIERVAAAAGLSPGTVVFHFATKDALLAATLAALAGEFDRARRRAPEPGDPAASLDALIVASFDPKISDPRKIAVWYAFWGEAKPRAAYMAQVGGLDAAYHQDLLRLMTRLVADGGYDGVDAEAATYGFAGLLEWLWQESLTEGRRFDRKRARMIARRYLASLFPRHFAMPAG
jgi:TetR/AcrR family transcriptional regulator, transcriptional repressor of bet genes